MKYTIENFQKGLFVIINEGHDNEDYRFLNTDFFVYDEHIVAVEYNEYTEDRATLDQVKLAEAEKKIEELEAERELKNIISKDCKNFFELFFPTNNFDIEEWRKETDIIINEILENKKAKPYFNKDGIAIRELEEGSECFSIVDHKVESCQWENGELRNEYVKSLECGNIFKTREDAQRELQRRNYNWEKMSEEDNV